MFDPYHKWLGIPKDQRPPTFYQLLGVSPDEQDLEVLDEAAIRQTTHVRAYQMGPHAADCTRVLNEIAKARLTLLNAEKRKEYDQQLGKAKPAPEPKQAETTQVAAPEVAEKVRVETPVTAKYADEDEDTFKLDRKRQRAEKREPASAKTPANLALIVGLAAGGLAFFVMAAVGVGMYLLLARGNVQIKQDPVVAQNGGKANNVIDPPVFKDEKDPPKIANPVIVPKPPPISNNGGFVPLFNGKDLGGLRVHHRKPGDWRVDNGILIGTGGDDSYVYAPRSDYKDFRLRLEARIDQAGVCEVNFRNQFDRLITQPGQGEFTGYRAILASTNELVGKPGTLHVWKRGDTATTYAGGPPIAPGEWFTMEVIALGNNLTVKVNGKITAHYTDLKNNFSAGHIFFRQALTGVVEFRKIEIQELNRAPAPIVAVNGGFVPPTAFVPLFNGKDFTNWKSRLDGYGGWRIDSGVLIGTSEAGSDLYTVRADYADFHLRMETRINDSGRAAVLFRSEFDPANLANRPKFYAARINSNFDGDINKTGSLSAFNGTGMRNLFYKEMLVPPGEWFSHEIIAKGEVIIIQVNGKITRSFRNSQDQINIGRILLQTPAPRSVVEFRKIEIGEFPKLAYTKFINRDSGKVLSVVNGATNAGAPIIQSPDAPGAAHQNWALVPTADGWFHIVNRASGNYMSMLNNTINEGAVLVIWGKKDGEPTQQWKFVPADAANPALVKIMNRAADKVVSIARPENPTAVLKTDVGGPDQIWTLDRPELAKLVPIKKKDDAPPTPPPAAARVALPDPDKTLEAEKAIREQFKKEYAKKSGADITALAEKLLQLARDTNDDPPSRYALLREARELATRAGRAELALKIAAQVSAAFDVDDLATRVETLTGFAKFALNPEQTKQFVEVAMQQSVNAQADDHFAEALKMLSAAETVLSKTKNAVLLGQVQKLEKQFRDTAKDQAEVKKALEKLAADPKDGPANLTVGAYLAFRKGDWDKGLPLLALSDSAEFQELAKKDAAAGSDEALRLEAGDAWWKAADKKPAYQKAAMQWRAAAWYRQALPDLKGVKQANAAERVKLVDAAPPPFRIVGGINEVDRYKGHAGAVTALVLAKDGKRVFSSGVDGTLREWNFAAGKSRVLLGPQFTKGPVASFAFNADERMLAYLNSAGKLTFLDSLTPPRFLKTAQRDAVPAFFWNDMRLNYADLKDWNSWDVTNSSSSKSKLIFNSTTDATPRAIILAPDLDQVAVLTNDRIVATFRSTGGAGRSIGPTIDFDATGAAFSKNGKFIVLGNKSGNLRLYRTGMNNPPEVVPLKGHQGAVRCAAFTPDGKQIITGGDDRVLRVWNAATGQEMQQFPHPGALTAVLATPDNRYAISASTDGVIRMWKLPTEKLAQR